MGKIPDRIVTKSGLKTESYYDYLISRYISPYFTVAFSRLEWLYPNQLTFISFFIIIVSGILTLNISLLDNIFYRIVIALIIQLSFILDCSDGQLARLTGRTSKLGGWLDKLLDRVGEFYIFSVFGIAAWHIYGNPLLVIFGVVTGYSLVAFTLAMNLSDSMKLENIKKIKAVRDLKKLELQDEEARDEERENGEIQGEGIQGENRNQPEKKSFRESRFSLVIQRVFFFLNFGIGERYLYLSFFMLIYRLDIMLYLSTFFTVLRFLSISYYVGNKLRKIDREIKQLMVENES